LNEVNGGSPSQLKGYTEVAGQAAHVIVANPYGVTCNGCGFINTPKATLTTGKPVIENGQVQRYQVDQGSVAIEGAGLNASNIDQFEIITRSASTTPVRLSMPASTRVLLPWLDSSPPLLPKWPRVALRDCWLLIRPPWPLRTCSASSCRRSALSSLP
ncbi:filamentous hemagglutinin N-terminal domain-containing protein, partial [Pseudomonas protegens]|nr:filamentous hemagglutinin N-terminal domain-containing protein [Pseudomonas protegens]